MRGGEGCGGGGEGEERSADLKVTFVSRVEISNMRGWAIVCRESVFNNAKLTHTK